MAKGEWTKSDWKNWGRRVWRPAAKEVGLKADTRPRDLRGSFASLMILEGSNVVEGAEQQGCSPVVFLRNYAGVFAEYDAANRKPAADAINEARRDLMCPESVLAPDEVSAEAQKPLYKAKPSSGLEPE